MNASQTLSFVGFAALLLSMLLTAVVANAQMNNKPFSFKGTPDGGIGISNAGKQAIIDYENFSIKSSTIIRGTNGELITISKGVGDSTIASYQGSNEIIPSYSGSSYKGSSSGLMEVGVFNSYFSTGSTDDSSMPFRSFFASSSESVNTWTTRVATDGYPTSFSPNSPVDNWTSFVFLK